MRLRVTVGGGVAEVAHIDAAAGGVGAGRAGGPRFAVGARLPGRAVLGLFLGEREINVHAAAVGLEAVKRRNRGRRLGRRAHGHEACRHTHDEERMKIKKALEIRQRPGKSEE